MTEPTTLSVRDRRIAAKRIAWRARLAPVFGSEEADAHIGALSDKDVWQAARNYGHVAVEEDVCECCGRDAWD